MVSDNNDRDKLNLDPVILERIPDGGPASQKKPGETCVNTDECVKEFNRTLQFAEKGDMKAQFRLADLYALGQGTQKNQAKAFQWYTKAALQGYKKALIRIHNLYQQDKRMYCRGQLNSSEEKWADEEFKKKHNIRELNEYRREQHALILNNVVDYYTEKFKYYKSPKEESIESDLNLAFLYQYGYGTRKNMLLAFDFYKKAAEQGHRDAQYGLAYLYQTNTDIKFNYRLALRWYRSSATNGNVAAQNCLAYFYEKGLATELSYEAALYWYTKAANTGNSSAQLTLGRLYRKGQGVEKNISKAIEWYKRAADQGNNAARNCLSQLHLAGKIPTTTDSDSVSQSDIFTLRSKLLKDITALKDSEHKNNLKKLVQHTFMTDGNAMFRIGLKYYNGEVFPQDKDIGFQWIKKAAKAGIKDAELKIARMYEDGDAVDQDYHQSSIWTMKTTKKRNDTALLKLGILYKDGLGVRKDPLEASKWFIMSAERGSTQAQFLFGLLRYYGEGVREDKEEAFECFYKAATMRNADAIYQIGLMYENNEFAGRNIPKEIQTYKSTVTVEEYKAAEVMKMYALSARLGNQNAQFRLARIYEEGNLIKEDLETAHRYYTMTADSNNPHYQVEMALKYINGHFKDYHYTKAFDLFKKAAEKNEPRAVSIFQTPIQPSDEIYDYTKVIDMFVFASIEGVDGIQFKIGYAYENGITFENTIIVNSNFEDSNIAANTGDSRAAYRIEVLKEKIKLAEKSQNMTSVSYSLAYEYGNSDIAYNLALMHLCVYQDFIKAFNLFTAASNMGHKEAYEKLLLSENSENMKMLEVVASSGNVAIQYQLGIYFENKNDSKSIEWLRLAAEGGVNDAYYRLGILYEEGRGMPTDYSQAIDLYKKAIEKDHEDAMFRLAQIYHHGKVIEPDYLKAYDLYMRAANIGHIGALKVLNLKKENGFSREKLNRDSQVFSSDELTSIISMMEFVAEQGNTDLQFELGYFYENNRANQNHSKALKWYTMATVVNHTEATYRLSLLYESGLGTIQNYSKSFQLYNKAKDQGSHYALYRLGIAFHHGYGTDRNSTKAVDCYTKAAQLGNHESQYTLGKLYETGELVQRDLIKALILYTNAYMNGNIDVILDLYNLYGDQSYEYFSYQRLSRILARLEKVGNAKNNIFQNTYGYMYYCLGRMYLEGNGTTTNDVEALKRFLVSENSYGYSNAKSFTTFIYDEKRDERNSCFQRMQAYFDIKDTLSSEQQYKIGMLYYNDAKCFHEEDPTKKKNITPLLTRSKDDDIAFQYMLLASKNNHTKAQYQLGIMYLLGHGVRQDEGKAVKWIEKYIEALDPKQCYKLGLDFYNGSGVIQNYRVAFIFMRKAINEDNPELKNVLGLMYFHGLGTEKNFDEAMKWLETPIKEMKKEEYYEKGMEFYKDAKVDNAISFIYIKKASEGNHSDAHAQLGVMYYYGRGIQQNYEKSMKWFEESTKEMNPCQCYKQGMMFYDGIQVDKNYEIALLYIRKAAKKKDNKAQAQLGIMYLQGYGVEQNLKKAMHSFQQSTIGWSANKCLQQGMTFYKGNEVNQNYEIAFIYIKAAAEENISEAQAQLGIIYLQGHGVEQNLKKAMHWFQQSTIGWGANKCLQQGMIFYEGNGVDQNYEIAFIYIKAAAERNTYKAKNQLGLMYLYGEGIEQNHVEAIKWFRQSINEMRDYECYRQGMKFYRDDEIDKSYEISILYIKTAAAKDHCEAQIQLGVMYIHGHGIEQNYEKAIEWLEKSTKKMVGYDLYRQGMKFYRDTKVDDKLSLIHLKKAAEDNYEDAQAQLGLMYSNGRGVEKNLNKAMEWIESSVKNMAPQKCYNQGIQFFNCNEIDQHYQLSLFYFRRAAEKNHMYSQAQSGYMYLNGYGVKQDSDETSQWYSKAICEYSDQPIYKIGQMYHYDSSGIQDFSKAFEFYHRESEDTAKGYALHGIGLLYEYGYGVGQDYEKAFEYYRQSTESSNIGGYFNLGLLFYCGRGVNQEYDTAFSFFTKVIKIALNSEEMYIFTENVNAGPKNDATGSTYYKHSLVTSDRICGEAHYYMGLMCENGQGRDKSEKEARMHFEEAFERGVHHARNFLK